MRKTKVVKVPMEGRDKDKQFLVTEMPASKAEKWAARAFLALANAGIDIPDDAVGSGMAALAIIGIRALGRVKFAEAEPLMDEMMECVQFMPDPLHPQVIRLVEENDIEEVSTRAWLRSEVFELHTGFSVAAAILASRPVENLPGKNSRNTKTSRGRLAQ